jgi:NADH-quinone oxidoreductase subunit E
MFFAHFNLKPKGNHVIRIRDEIDCHVKKSDGLIDALKNKLVLKEVEYSTKDMLFTIETISCLGTCGLAPVFLIDESVYARADESR